MCDKNLICPSGCKIPKTINESKCHPEVFKNSDGTFFRMCNYDCDTSILEKCKTHNKYCNNCGYVKFNINDKGVIQGKPIKIPLNNNIIKDDKVSSNSDIIFNITGNKFVGYDSSIDYPSPEQATHEPTKSIKNSNVLNTMTSILDNEYKKLLNKTSNTREYPCRDSVTGMFTVCSVPESNGFDVNSSLYSGPI